MFDLPGDWSESELRKAVQKGRLSFTDGDWIEASYIASSGIRLLQTGNIGRGFVNDKPETRRYISLKTFGELGCKWVRHGDILICRLADPIGRACEIPEHLDKSITSVDVTILRVDPSEYSARYVLHYLNSEINLRLAADSAGGSTRSRISRTNLGKLPLPNPPLAQQKKIAEVFDTLDTQIQKTEALIAKLEKVKEGLLHDLLTRGIDENGQLRPSPEQAPELYKESSLGLIPREWEVASVDEVGDIVTGSTPPSAATNSWGGPHLFFTPADIGDYEPLKVSERTLSESGAKHVRLIPEEAILVVCIGSTIGKVGITSGAGATNQQINSVIPSPKWSNYFVYQAIRHHVGQIHAWAGLQAVPIVNKSTFGKMLIPQPQTDEQNRIAKSMQALDERVSEERIAVGKLREEKTGLMDDLLTGRVRVTSLLEQAQEPATA
jgi:type I restriction enzyme S subunit